MTSTTDAERHAIMQASAGRPFRFEQGASLQAVILGMVYRPSGPHDEGSFLAGVSRDGRSHGRLGLGHLQAADEHEAPDLEVWFDPDSSALDISAAFSELPAETLDQLGIPAPVIEGPIMVERRGDAAEGIAMLVAQMSMGKFAVDPQAMLDVLGSDQLVGFDEHEIDDERPLRAFHGYMSLRSFLDALGHAPNTLINQIATIGCDLRTEAGPEAVTMFDAYADQAPVELAWLVDEENRVHTSQAMITLTDFINDVLTQPAVLARLAEADGCSVEHMTEFVTGWVDEERMGYVYALWQLYDFDDDIEPIPWPDAVDLSAEVGEQASRLQKGGGEVDDDSDVAHALEADVDLAAVAINVTVDDNMIESMRANSGAMHFVLSAVVGDVATAVSAAQDAILTVPHPDEPTEPLASFLSDAVMFEGGGRFWADISDMETSDAVLEAVVEAVVEAVAEVVSSAHLSGEPAD